MSGREGEVLVLIVLLLVFTVAPIIVAARLAERRGRSVWLGIVPAFFLGWIGVLVVLLTRRNDGRAHAGGRRPGVRQAQQGSHEPAARERDAGPAGGEGSREYVGLDHVQVAAPPGREFDARRFYGGLLGLPEIDKPPFEGARGGCWFGVGDQALHVGVADGFEPARKAHPALRLAGSGALDEVAERLVAAGYEVEWADEAEIAGVRRFHVHDPFGNRVELLARA